MSELRKANHELEKSLDSFSSLCQLCPSPYLALTENGLINIANSACSDLFGTPAAKLKNKSFSRYIAEEDRDNWNRLCHLAKQSESRQSGELCLIRQDGSRIQTRAEVFYAKALETASRWLITLIDITPYRQVDEAQRIADVFFQTQNGIVVTNEDKTIIKVNEAFTRITGYTAAEAINQPIGMLSSESHDESFYQNMWVAIMSKGYWQGEISDKRKNGEIYPAWLTITGVFDQNNRVTHYVGCMLDISGHKQAEKILLENHQRLTNPDAFRNETLEEAQLKIAEIDAALAALRSYKETGKIDANQKLSLEVEETLIPFLKKLKSANSGHGESAQLLEQVEDNLNRLIVAYSRKFNSPDAFEQLSSVELRIACLIRQGMGNEAIAGKLSITEEELNEYCNQIRNKLGLTRKTESLYMFLKTLHL